VKICTPNNVQNKDDSANIAYGVITATSLDARSEDWVGGRSLDGIAGSIYARVMDVCCECCVLSGRGFCEELIPRLGNFYRVFVCH